MNTVRLHSALHPINIFQQERQHRHMILGCQQSIGLVELPDVIGAIVRRQGDAAQHHLGAGIEQRGHDPIEILAGAGDGQSAQAIVSAEGHDHQHWLQPQCVLQPIDSVLGGVSADALVDHLVVIAFASRSFCR